MADEQKREEGFLFEVPRLCRAVRLALVVTAKDGRPDLAPQVWQVVRTQIQDLAQAILFRPLTEEEMRKVAEEARLPICKKSERSGRSDG